MKDKYRRSQNMKTETEIESNSYLGILEELTHHLRQISIYIPPKLLAGTYPTCSLLFLIWKRHFATWSTLAAHVKAFPDPYLLLVSNTGKFRQEQKCFLHQLVVVYSLRTRQAGPRDCGASAHVRSARM